MNDLTKTNLNKRLHLALGRGNCQWGRYPADGSEYWCLKCGTHSNELATQLCRSKPPTYDTDLNLCAEAEKEVIERVGEIPYGGALYDVLCRTHPIAWVPTNADMATASAPDRVEAMLAALEEK